MEGHGNALKLEKEALEKGVPPGQSHDIDIPPPRPKRKPSNPYPRKSNLGSLSPLGEVINGRPSQSMSFYGESEVMDIGSEDPLEKLQSKDASEGLGRSEVLNVFQDSLSTSASSASNISSNQRKYLELFPFKKKMDGDISIDKSSIPHYVEQELGKSFLGVDKTGQSTKQQINLSLEVSEYSSNLRDVTSKDILEGGHTHIKHHPSSSNFTETENTDVQNPAAVTEQSGGQMAAVSGLPFLNPP